MTGSLQILVTSFLVFHHLGCVIFCTMFSLCKARWARQKKGKKIMMNNHLLAILCRQIVIFSIWIPYIHYMYIVLCMTIN